MSVNILIETILVTGISALGIAIPLHFSRREPLPRWLLPLATGAMAGLCCFSLIPEVFKEGGQKSIGLTAVAALAFSGLHMRYHKHQLGTSPSCDHLDVLSAQLSELPGSEQSGMRATLLLFISMFFHSLFDGALLVSSKDLLVQALVTILASLGIHKLFESISLGSIILSRVQTLATARPWLIAYILSFPFGVGLSLACRSFFSGATLQIFALVTMAVAIGNLISCLIFDFIWPTVLGFRQDKRESIWLMIGLAFAACVAQGL